MDAFSEALNQLSSPQFLGRLAQCVNLAYSEDVDGILLLLSDLEPHSGAVIRWGPSSTDMVVSVWFDGSVFLYWPGLSGIADYVEALLRSGQISCVSCPGSISSFVAAKVMPSLPQLLQNIDDNCDQFGTPVANIMIVGHSQGGANALGFFALTSGPMRAKIARVQVVSFQSPRCLSQAAATSLSVPHLRVSVASDLVSHIPPCLWTVNYPPFSPPLGGLATYIHHGQGVQLQSPKHLHVLGSDSPIADVGAFVVSGGILSASVVVARHNIALLARSLGDIKEPIHGLEGLPGREEFDPFFLGASSMGIFKCAYQFKHGSYGWSETHYLEASDFDAARATATGFAITNARCGILAYSSVTNTVNPVLEAVRISDGTNSRVANTYYLRQQGSFTALGPADATFVSLLVSFECKIPSDPAPFYKKNIFVRGVPDQLVGLGGQYIPNGAFLTAFNAWFTALKTTGFGMTARWKGATNIPIASLTNGTNKVTVVTTSGHAFFTGDVVSITEVLPKGALHGNFRVIVNDSTSFDILGVQVVGVVSYPGQVREYEKIFVPYFAGQVDRITRRDTGRPFDSPVGRQKTR